MRDWQDHPAVPSALAANDAEASSDTRRPVSPDAQSQTGGCGRTAGTARLLARLLLVAKVGQSGSILCPIDDLQRTRGETNGYPGGRYHRGSRGYPFHCAELRNSGERCLRT